MARSGLMVTYPERHRASELIERFSNAEITRTSSIVLTSTLPDRALEVIFVNIWLHYSHTDRHKLLCKHPLNADARALFSRCASFLRSNLELRMPENCMSRPETDLAENAREGAENRAEVQRIQRRKSNSESKDLALQVSRHRRGDTINMYGRYYRRKLERSGQAIRSVHI